jgi:aspartate aminotransferase-like enzyme
MQNYLIMTPGPTPIRENVRQAMMQPITNPDLDSDFYKFYGETVNLFKDLVKTQNFAYILNGEGILGLEAACASLIEPGDRVLCIENGIFGKGFGDFVEMYGGQVVYFSGHPQKGIDPEALKTFLDEDSAFKFATLVHCETPSGLTNPIHDITPLLKAYGILSVVDAVSAVGGEVIKTDEWAIDILLVGSQKCLSAAPGLTLLTVSPAALDLMENRQVPIKGFYSNILIWKDWEEKQWFPYTQPISAIYGLKVALENALEDKDQLDRHEKLATACRKTIEAAGLKLFPLNSYSNTVTAIQQPSSISFDHLFDYMKVNHKILIAGAFGPLKDKVIRLGHMGENANAQMLSTTFAALQKGLEAQDLSLDIDMKAYFEGLL